MLRSIRGAWRPIRGPVHAVRRSDWEAHHDLGPGSGCGVFNPDVGSVLFSPLSGSLLLLNDCGAGHPVLVYDLVTGAVKAVTPSPDCHPPGEVGCTAVAVGSQWIMFDKRALPAAGARRRRPAASRGRTPSSTSSPKPDSSPAPAAGTQLDALPEPPSLDEPLEVLSTPRPAAAARRTWPPFQRIGEHLFSGRGGPGPSRRALRDRKASSFASSTSAPGRRRAANRRGRSRSRRFRHRQRRLTT